MEITENKAFISCSWYDGNDVSYNNKYNGEDVRLPYCIPVNPETQKLEELEQFMCMFSVFLLLSFRKDVIWYQLWVHTSSCSGTSVHICVSFYCPYILKVIQSKTDFSNF